MQAATTAYERLTSLTLEDFRSALDTEFSLAGEEATGIARLMQLLEMSAPPGYEQFSLSFKSEAPVAGMQGTCLADHETLGAFPLFLVLVGRDDSCWQYEAVFSRAAVQVTQ